MPSGHLPRRKAMAARRPESIGSAAPKGVAQFTKSA
jgi:hypothetical protein